MMSTLAALAMTCQSPPILTTGQLCQLLGVNRHTLTHWCDSGQLRCYRLPTQRNERRIELSDALEFAERHQLPVASLQNLAQQHGVLPLRCPTVLLISPVVSIWLPFWAGIFDATPASSSLRAGLILGRRTFRAVLLDAALGGGEVREHLHLLSERCPETTIGYLAAEDDARPKLWLGLGCHLVWQRPVDLAQVAHELWTHLSSPFPPSAPSTPPAPRRKRAA